MMQIIDVKNYLKTEFPDVKFYLGTIPKGDDKCVGVYARGSGRPNVAIGGIENSSFTTTPCSLLIHWTEDYSQADTIALQLYNKLIAASGAVIGGKRVISMQMADPRPVDVGRDSNNIAEMVIRLNIIHER